MKNFSENIVVKQKLDFDKQVIVPTHMDLIKARDKGIPLISRSPYAVFVRKITSTQRNNLSNSIDLDKQVITEICNEFDLYSFIVHFQYAAETTFNQKELDYMEQVQQIAELNHISMCERDPHQTVTEFNLQLDSFVKRNIRKIVVPFLEPNSYQLIEKIKSMKERNLTEGSIIFRGAKEEDRAELSTALFNLRENKIFSFVVGIFPRKWRETGASMFLPALQFKASAMSTWIPWGGGPSSFEFLCSDWLFKEQKDADKGKTDYSGLTRAELFSKNKGNNFKITLMRIDMLNQADSLASNFVPLTKTRFESLFNR
jgi:hypothetical protein